MSFHNCTLYPPFLFFHQKDGSDIQYLHLTHLHKVIRKPCYSHRYTTITRCWRPERRTVTEGSAVRGPRPLGILPPSLLPSCPLGPTARPQIAGILPCPLLSLKPRLMIRGLLFRGTPCQRAGRPHALALGSKGGLYGLPRSNCDFSSKPNEEGAFCHSQI